MTSRLLLIGLLGLGTIDTRAAFESVVDETVSVEKKADPAIIAKVFNLNVFKRSRSNRVYIFMDLDNRQPDIGRIFLARRGGENAMAFRVIKSYDAGTKFAGSRVKRLYPYIDQLNVTDPLLAVEKEGDVFPARTSKEEKEDNKDLLEIENENPDLKPDAPKTPETPSNDEDFDDEEPPAEEAAAPKNPSVEPFDPELDETTSPAPKDALLRQNKDPMEDIVVDEVTPHDPDNHGASVEMGLLRNIDATGSSSFFSGAGIRYGFTFSRSVFFRDAETQDSFTADAGLFMYRVLNYQPTQGDTYTVMPIEATVRYNIHFTPGFSAHSYFGFIKNTVLTAFEGTDLAIQNLSSLLPAFGVGMQFRIGPKWFVRTDIGIDMIGAGLVLRF